MVFQNFYPLYFQPIYKNYVWGGGKISSAFNRRDAPQRVAESWEISDRQDGRSVVANGPLQGQTLRELVEKLGEDLLGKGRHFPSFPLLIKWIDAQENLSLQLHPDERAAKRLGSEPKAEMWYFLQSDPGAAVLAGWKVPMDEAAFLEAIQRDRIAECVRKIPVSQGDVISIPGGRVHAILAGCFLLEVQQNSNTTYRIYDWGRGSAETRPLHITEACKAMDGRDTSSAKIAPKLLHEEEGLLFHQLLKTPYFEMQKIEAHKNFFPSSEERSFQIFLALERGAVLIAEGWEEAMALGRIYLVPAACRNIEIKPGGRGSFLRITL